VDSTYTNPVAIHPAIDLPRLRQDLLELASIGRHPEDQGVYRLAFTDEDMQARRWLMGRIEQAGGKARLDEAGNVVGRWFDDLDEPALVLGSHIDSVAAAGIFDGTLGVMAGLECLRVIVELDQRPERPLELVAFADEEGRFGGMFGAQAYCGLVTPDWVGQAESVFGVRLEDAMREQGLDPMRATYAARHPEDLHAFLELHIEQGPVLEAENRRIGVVTGISGVFKWLVRLIGKANHAGTAPMNMRSDAFMGLADFAHEIARIVEEDGSDSSRLTVGTVDLKPGYPHTIPGEVEFSLVGRDADATIMQQLGQSCQKVLGSIARRHNLRFEYDERSWLDPRDCHPDVIEAFERHAQALGQEPLRMPSGAGHDTQFMTEITRAGMIFVPSMGGVSHAPDEWTHWADVEIGANVLLHTAMEFAGLRGGD
jgi:N-carbamoyl-L-amino-acid hydrolase